MDFFDEIIAKVIPDAPKTPIRETLPWLPPEMEAIRDPLKKVKVKAYSKERKETFPHRPKRLHACPCRPSESSDSCLDGRYLTKIMTSKDILFPPIDDISIKPTESEILARFTAKEIAEFRDSFDYFDLECKGYIEVPVVLAKMRTLNETGILPEMIELMKDISLDGDGKINFSQFLRLIARSRIHTDRAKRLREAFEIMDPKLTGYIPANELRFTLINIGEILTDEQVDLMIPQLDINDDGQVFYEDIVQLICRKEEFTGESFYEEESFDTEILFDGRRDVECPPYQIESSSSGMLDKYVKAKEEEAKKEAKDQELKWNTIMDIEKTSANPKKKVETHDVGV